MNAVYSVCSSPSPHDDDRLPQVLDSPDRVEILAFGSLPESGLRMIEALFEVLVKGNLLFESELLALVIRKI